MAIDHPSFKPVFILGAGASDLLGLPLLKDFLARARTLRYSAKLDERARIAFDRVFEYQTNLFQTKRYLGVDLENLETLFSVLDMNIQVAPNEEEQNELIGRRNAFLTLIVETLKLSSGDRTTYGQILTRLSAHPLSTFITLNYDLAIENAFQGEGREGWNPPDEKMRVVDYDDAEHTIYPPESRRYVLKLHGSVNWTYCGGCKKFAVHGSEHIRADHLENSVLKFHNVGCKEAVPTLVLVPPTWYKSNSNEQITRVWKQAIGEMQLATHMIIIGYSMPRTDVFFDQLLTLGVHNNPDLKKVIVVNYSMDIKPILQKLFDRHFLRDRVVFLNTRFENLNAVHRDISSEALLEFWLKALENFRQPVGVD